MRRHWSLNINLMIHNHYIIFLVKSNKKPFAVKGGKILFFVIFQLPISSGVDIIGQIPFIYERRITNDALRHRRLHKAEKALKL